jgi:uncharacterized protein YukE
MSKAAVDPAELRRFAQDLNRFNGDLIGLVQSLKSKMTGLEATWRDQEQRKFAETFEQMMRTISLFMPISEEQVKFLNKKAVAIEEYLKVR